MNSVEVHSAEPSRKERKCPYLGNHWTDCNQNWCVDAYTMHKFASKKSRRSRCAATSSDLGTPVYGKGEMREAKSGNLVPKVEDLQNIE